MGRALVGPVGSVGPNGARRSALCRVIVLSGATMAAIAAPILVSLVQNGPVTTTVIAGGPAAMPDEVGVGPLLDRRWVRMAGPDPVRARHAVGDRQAVGDLHALGDPHAVGELLADPGAQTGGWAASGARGESPSKPTESRPNSDQPASGTGGCGSCDVDPVRVDAEDGTGTDAQDGTGTDAEGEAAPAPITVVHPTTTRPAKVPNTTTTDSAGSVSSSTPSSAATAANTAPGGSIGSTASKTPASPIAARRRPSARRPVPSPNPDDRHRRTHLSVGCPLAASRSGCQKGGRAAKLGP